MAVRLDCRAAACDILPHHIMTSKKQKKLLRYIEEGSVLKLKSYIRKHRHLDINCALKKGRTPLHIACGLRDDAVVRLLLKHGANPLLQDNKGNTPLHVAAQKAADKGKRVYDDLVIPLKKHCPAAMEIANQDGVTPRGILQWMKQEEQYPGYSVEGDGPSEVGKGRAQTEREWYQKLFGECEDEYYQTHGQYEEDFYLGDPEPEMYDDWAARIAKEYTRRRMWEEGRGFRRKAAEDAEKKERRKQEQQEFQRKLEEEHQRYLQRAQQKGDELKSSKKDRYVEKCTNIFSSGSTSKLKYSDIPWPCRNGTVEEMTAVILHGVDPGDKQAYRRYLRQQQALWHPDKFLQRCSARLEDKDRQRILDTVTALSQALNRLSEDAK